jgi:copper(I)-binding protein
LAGKLIAALLAWLFAATVVAEEAPDLVFENVWIRALPASQPNTAAYLTVANRGKDAVAIVGASADVARKTEIHTTREVDGYLRMEKLPGLALAPEESLELIPGGTHLMLFDLVYTPVPGDEINVCLLLDSGDEICAVAQVRKVDPGRSAKSQHHNH